MQYSLFDYDPSNSPIPCTTTRSRKVIEIKRVPSMQTIQKYCWGASIKAPQMSDKDLVCAWKYAFALQAYWRLGRRPADFHHRAHYHMAVQILDTSRLSAIEDEMFARGLMDKYELDVSLPHHRQ